MRKKQFPTVSGLTWSRKSTLSLTIKLIALVLLFPIFRTFALNDYKVYGKDIQFTFKMENVPMKTVLRSIEEQTEFSFVYNSKLVDVNRKVNIDVSGQNINEVLDKLFADTNINYEIVDRHILLSVKNIDNKTVNQQQQVTVRGRVQDTQGNPLPGVTVIIKGTNQGTITDTEGNFSLSIPEDTEFLQFSFVGMKTQEVPIAGQTTFNIVMEEEVIGLQEVVAIGYGTMRKSDLTGAIASVTGDVLAERKTVQLSQALQGAIPGVMVTRDNNAPGSTATIRIRGITTIGDSSPLIIVDGVPVDNINNVNPNDIQDISVLKDAASAAIYGARAAGGVILVTTKRAKPGELTLTYNADFGIETPTALPEMVDVIRFMEMENEMRWNDNGNIGTEYPTYPKEVIENYYQLHAEDPNRYPITDWMDLILEPYAPRQSHVIGISAGTNAIRTKASIAYDKMDGLYQSRSYQRITARINNDATINKRMNASLDFYWKRSISDQPSIDPMYYGMLSAPVYPAVWSDGRIAGGKSGNNIYAQLKYGGFRDDWYNTIGGKVQLDFTPLKGLKFSAIVSPNFNFDKGKDFIKAVPYYSAEDPTVFMGTMQFASTTKLSEARNDNYQVTTQFLANYTNSFDQHNIAALAGYENFYAFYENLGASRDEYELTDFPYLNLGPLEFRDNSGNAWENAYRSWFGRIMYNYQNKYFLQGNIRYDGSSRFHKDHRWGTFPSFSAGWVISEESFMENMRSWLSFLKLRGSWGNLGNERIGNYPYQATIGFSNALFYKGNEIVSAQTAAQWQYAIQDITWEKTESYDIGIDAYFIDNQLRFSGDYYKKTTKDMLLPLEIPDYIGFDNPDQNTGKMETNGWEAEIGWNDTTGDLKYSISFNISDSKSVMGDLGGIQFLGDQVKFKGSEFNEWYGYRSDGLFQTEEEVKNSPVLNKTVRTGDVKYKDISGPDGVPDGIISPDYDRTLLGGSLPRYLYGGNIRLDYKGMDFSMVIQGVGKVWDRLDQTMIRPLLENWMHAQKIIDGNYWSHYNTDEQNLKARYPRLTWTAADNNYAMSDFWLINGAYFRMKNITLGYTIPANITQKMNIKGIRLYTSISDLFTIDNYPKGWDPEVASSGYPITTSYVFGLSLNF